MISKRNFLIGWIGGLVAFAVVVYLHGPLTISEVPGGILDHQAAPDGATVDTIHAAWKAAGVFDQASVAMIGDLVFIQIYSIGAFLGGRYYLRKADTLQMSMGGIVSFAACVFFLTDNAETISQLIQVTHDRGSDQLAWIASTCQGPKSVTFVMTALGLIIALIRERFRP